MNFWRRKAAMKVLLVEDDIQLNTTIKQFLESIGDEVKSVMDGEDAIDFIDKEFFDFYIIDINIPSVNGLELVRYIRQKDLKTPVVIITASMELGNFQTAFEYGCSEYIKKPFFLEELELRMKRLVDVNREEIIQIAEGIVYNVEYEELRIKDEVVSLRKKERRLLHILLQSINHTVETETICAYVWENEIKESYPLRQLVNDLRKKLSNKEKFIFSDAGRGYRFETAH